MAFAPPRRAASTTIRPDGSTRSASGIASTGSTRPASVTSSSRVVRPTDATRSVRTSWIPQLSPVKPKSKAALVDGNGDDAGENIRDTNLTRAVYVVKDHGFATRHVTHVVLAGNFIFNINSSVVNKNHENTISPAVISGNKDKSRDDFDTVSNQIINPYSYYGWYVLHPTTNGAYINIGTPENHANNLNPTACITQSYGRRKPSRRQAVQPETPPRRPASSLTQQDLTSTSIEKERQQRHYRTKLYQLLYEIKNFPPAHHPSTVASLKERYKALQEKEQALHKRQLGNVFQKEIRSLEEVLTLGTTVEIADAIRRAERVLAAPREAGISRLRHAKQGLGRVQTGPGRLRDVVEGMKELLRVEITVMELDREFEALRAGMEEAEVLEEFEKGWEESLSADIKSAWLSV
ncbi:hypothetical protein SAICODRAFT_72605 [Saitoella complicata NRRL Y-17804]|uniref:uncharacterized protein n=1 Tax=Saitoella complicata (strain BCRC 22490 / CBS 7301 / JCM 7358 / NBRC 10748 / NRRL Y-17804) TaxID=698492 RepID=UPI000866C31C|nr:uncharacterized protein SAICODRAFT_72605 [Saitoella complicata NRRL Y-17804]ODQ51311.1 hypothetical protein SAICODRAFT_72605 [Saitoella complicata NRRL Y-17804]